MCAVSEVVRVVAMMTTEMGQSTAFIRVMERMLGSRAAPPATLTPIHVYLLRAYILGDFMRPARELLRRSVLEVDPLGTTLTSEEFLLYFLYAARVHATLSDWRACLDALRACITFPALITSAIQVDAYKMFVLVSLIHTGSVPDLPTSTSPIVARTIARVRLHPSPLRSARLFPFGFPSPPFSPSFFILVILCTCRRGLVRTTQLAGPAVADVRVAFADARSSDALVAALTAHREALVRDCLFGLSEHLPGSWLRHRISRLTNTFVTLTLREIAEICGLRSAADAEAELLRMMEEGRIEAVIDAREGRVSFGGDADAHGFDDIATMRRLESLLGKTAALAAGISRVEESLVRDVKYHAGAAHSSSRRDEGLPTEFAGAGGHFGPGSADGDD